MSEAESTTALIPMDKLASLAAIKEKCERYRNTIVLPLKDAGQYLSAMETARILDSDFKTVEEIRAEANEPYAKATKDIGLQCNPIKEAVKGLLKQFNDACIKWQNDEQARRDAEQERLNREAEAVRKVAEEKARIAREVEERHLRLAQQATDDVERQRLSKIAEKNRQIAERAETKAENTIAPLAQTQAPKMQGMFTKGTPQFECSDLPKFVNWCVDTKQLHLLTFNEAACVAMSKVYGKDTVVPGGRFFIGQTIVRRERGFK